MRRNINKPMPEKQTEADKISLVLQDWRVLETLHAPSEIIQLVAVAQDWRAYALISGPTEDVYRVAKIVFDLAN